MGKEKIKQKLLYPVSHDASVLHDLCSMRDDDFCKMFNKTQLDQLITDILHTLIVQGRSQDLAGGGGGARIFFSRFGNLRSHALC